MGTLGAYLRDAREAMGLDLREAAQQTRISLNYLKALEQEEFSKLPGEVFVKGFLKNYGRFLNLPESEVLKRYGELKPQPSALAASAQAAEQKAAVSEREKTREIPLEPFVWGAGILIALIVFLFTSLPGRHSEGVHPAGTEPAGAPPGPESTQAARPDKLYLEIVALEDAWVLVRTDSSPQKKAVLKKGESLIWSADERFLLSYGGVGAIKLMLNGEELTVKAAKGAVVRDLAITSSGIMNQDAAVEHPVTPKPKPKPRPQAQPQSPPQPQQAPQPEQQPQPQPAAAPPAPAAEQTAPTEIVSPPKQE